MSERAIVGDVVRVWWDGETNIDGVVQHVPQDVGDSWVLIEDDGSIVHVNLFYGMRVLSRKAERHEYNPPECKGLSDIVED
jgi:hypothetical protein